MWGLGTHSTFPDVRSERAALTVGSSILSAVLGHFEKAAGRSSGSICLFSFPSLTSRINWEVRLWDYLWMSICVVNRDACLCFLYVQILKNSWSAPFSESGYYIQFIDRYVNLNYGNSQAKGNLEDKTSLWQVHPEAINKGSSLCIYSIFLVNPKNSYLLKFKQTVHQINEFLLIWVLNFITPKF